MRCRKCYDGPGTISTMELRGSSLYVCPVFSCGAQVTLTDAGLQLERPPLPRQPSPFREVSPVTPSKGDARLCGWAHCRATFVPRWAGQMFCDRDCRYAKQAADREPTLVRSRGKLTTKSIADTAYSGDMPTADTAVKRRLAIAVEDVA